jgi:D-amino-acid dehydrogenase
MARDTVIVVGAGHIGIACAHYLVRDGYDVTVIDQHEVGGACSQANCGYLAVDHVLPLTQPGKLGEAFTSLFRPRAAFRIRPQLRPELLRWLAEFGRRCTRRKMLAAAGVLHALLDATMHEYRTLLADPRLACEWQDDGLLYVFESKRALGAFAETDALLTREFGVTANFIRGDDLSAFEPALREGLAGAYHSDICGHVRPDRLNASWSAMLEDEGVRFVEHCRLEHVVRNETSIDALATTQGSMQADRYVFATGAWSRRWEEALLCTIPVEPGKGYSVTMTRPESMPGYPMLFPEKHVGVTPFEDGLRIASMMEFAGFDTSIPKFRIRQLQQSARPFLRNPTGPAMEERWYGWRPMTWDSLPIIGRLPALSNALIATGHNMLGLTLAPVTGKLVADLVSERASDLPLDAVSVERFG